MKFRDWNTASYLFFATCEHCGERYGGIDLLTHNCAPMPAEFWRQRYFIERRYAQRMVRLLVATDVALLVLAALRMLEALS